MTICKYFLQGSCKFGDQCRFEHIDANGHDRSAGMSDPFAPSPANGQGKRHSNRGGGGGGGGGKRPGPTRDKPQWPLTSVGSHPVASGNLVTGDMSQEELRVLAYQQAPQTRGCSDEVVIREQGLVTEFQQKNNSAPAPSTHHAAARDPFAGQQQQQHLAPQLQPQQPIFGGVAPGAMAQAQHNAPIFPTAPPTAAPTAFAAPAGAPPAYQQPPPVLAPHGAAPTGAATSTFAFQKVPETAPSFQ
jgi:nucleoporin NUP42